MPAGEMRFALTLDNTQFNQSVVQSVTAANQAVSNASRAARAFGRSLGQVSSFVAPQFSSSMTMVAAGIGGIREAATAAGIGIGSMVGALTVAAASMWSVNRAVEAFKDMKKALAFESDTSQRFGKSLESYRDSLSGPLEIAKGEGMLTDSELAMAKQAMSPASAEDTLRASGLAVTPESISALNAARGGMLNDLHKRLSGLGLMPKSADNQAALEEYAKIKNGVAAMLQGPEAERVNAIRDKFGGLLEKALDVSQLSGQPFEPLRTSIMQAMDKELANVGEQPARTATASRYSPAVTSIEKMGFVMGGSADPGRETAQNTRKSNQLLEQIVRNTQNTEGSFANRN